MTVLVDVFSVCMLVDERVVFGVCMLVDDLAVFSVCMPVDDRAVFSVFKSLLILIESQSLSVSHYVHLFSTKWDS